MAWRGPTTKYGNHKITIDGITFDSKKEAGRYKQLKLLEKGGYITDLQMQVKFVLIPTQRAPDEVGVRGGKIKGKVLERECCYIADFCYTNVGDGVRIVEDTKGFRTKDYLIKRKLMLFVHGIRIKEI